MPKKKPASPSESKTITEEVLNLPKPSMGVQKFLPVQSQKFLPLPGRKFLYFIVLTLLVGAGGTSYYFYDQYQKAQTLLKSQAGTAEKEVEAIVSKVDQLIELPQEVPTLATVSDINKLKQQKFFARAKNGDKVLIYEQAQTAYLYRPSVNKLIEVGPVSFSTPSQAQVAGAADQQEASPSAKATVTLLNGTTTVGLTGRAEKTVLSEAEEWFEIYDKDNAATNTHEKTIIIDVTSKNGKAVEKLAGLLNASIGSLPDGETAPTSDILVILGKDYAGQQ